MTRIILVFLFPVAFLSAVAIDRLKLQTNLQQKTLFTIIPLLLLEFSAIPPWKHSKAEWRNRLAATEFAMPANLPQNAILFYAQKGDAFSSDELDAMWAALNHGLPTLNGYSGLYPPGYSVEFGDDCAELPQRIQQYLGFIGQPNNNDAYLALMRRVVPVGFSGCNPDWLVKRPYTVSNREYTPDEIKRLSFEFVGRSKYAGKEYVEIKVNNNGALHISAASAVNKPLRLSWRFIGADGSPLSGWDRRKSIPYDIPANGSVNVRVPVQPESVEGGQKLQISIVQEFAFWGHDVGMSPLEIEWASE
jgi:hypothetical protein